MLTILPNTPRACDKVLLEWELLTELQEQGKIEYLLPMVSAR